MIHQPNEIATKVKKLRILIAGYPGIGKTTLGLSAPAPLHIDVDHGIDRIAPRHRKAYIQPQNYTELLNDLTAENLVDFESLVFDTGGKLLDVMKSWAIKNDPKNGKRDGSLSLQGYGAVGREFTRLMDYCYYELDKNVIILFHAVEEKDGENTKLRLMIEGGTKNTVWIPMDLGGFMEMQGNNRTIGFSNCERYFAKGTRGISGVMTIPEVKGTGNNTFLTKLFAMYRKNIAKDAEEYAAIEDKYNAAMKLGNEIINAIVDADTANLNMERFKNIKHELTSKQELSAAWTRKTKELGLAYDAGANCYKGVKTDG